MADMTTEPDYENTHPEGTVKASSSEDLQPAFDNSPAASLSRISRKRTKSEFTRHIWNGRGLHECHKLVELQKLGWCWKGYGLGEKPGTTNYTNFYFERGDTRIITKDFFKLCESVERGYTVYKLNEEEDDRMGVLRWLMAHLAAEPFLEPLPELANGNDVSAELKAASTRPMDLQTALDQALKNGPETIEDNVKLCFSNAQTYGTQTAPDLLNAASVLAMRFDDAMRCVAHKKRRVIDCLHHDTQSMTHESQDAEESTDPNTVDGATDVVDRIVAELSIAKAVVIQLDKKQDLLAKTVELHANSPHGLEIILTSARNQLDSLRDEKRTLEATIVRLAADLKDGRESALRSINRTNLLALAFYNLKRNRTETGAIHQRVLLRHRREAAAAYIEASRRERERMHKSEQLQQAALDAAVVSIEATHAAAIKRDYAIDQALRRALVTKRADLRLSTGALPATSSSSFTQ